MINPVIGCDIKVLDGKRVVSHASDHQDNTGQPGAELEHCQSLIVIFVVGHLSCPRPVNSTKQYKSFSCPRVLVSSSHGLIVQD